MPFFCTAGCGGAPAAGKAAFAAGAAFGAFLFGAPDFFFAGFVLSVMARSISFHSDAIAPRTAEGFASIPV